MRLSPCWIILLICVAARLLSVQGANAGDATRHRRLNESASPSLAPDKLLQSSRRELRAERGTQRCAEGTGVCRYKGSNTCQPRDIFCGGECCI
ncbi:hypothetical protein CLOM_g10356 [Closterium sp. NIES-68]|nr:hypothetical protein CLOM_g10356 [Closterium sp. NIES-68]